MVAAKQNKGRRGEPEASVPTASVHHLSANFLLLASTSSRLHTSPWYLQVHDRTLGTVKIQTIAMQITEQCTGWRFVPSVAISRGAESVRSRPGGRVFDHAGIMR